MTHLEVLKMTATPWRSRTGCLTARTVVLLVGTSDLILDLLFFASSYSQIDPDLPDAPKLLSTT